MTEGQPITSEGSGAPDPNIPVERTTPPGWDNPVVESAHFEESVEAIDPKAVLNDTVEGYVDLALEKFGLEKTSTNYNKVMNSLTYNFLNQIQKQEVALSEVSDSDVAKMYFKMACERRGMENKADNWKKVIQLLKEI